MGHDGSNHSGKGKTQRNPVSRRFIPNVTFAPRKLHVDEMGADMRAQTSTSKKKPIPRSKKNY